MKQFLFCSLGWLLLLSRSLTWGQAVAAEPLRVGIARLTHTHVHGLLGRPSRGDIEIVGIYEPNRELAERYATQHGFDWKLVFDDMQTMLDQTRPQAVVAFGSIFEHLSVVETCAPRNIHVMVEKPLAVNLGHAEKMAALARQYGIHLLTNYETTWYPSTHAAYDLVHRQTALGPIRKVVVHDGHPGPVAIGVNEEFLEWLTDPMLNGGGALSDFGCYGANLMTWLMRGTEPTSVTCVIQQLNPRDYPQVEDEATIVLTYPAAQCIIQASWNWPISRKDMEIYGLTGQVHVPDGRTLLIRRDESSSPETLRSAPLAAPHDDPFALLAAVINGRSKLNRADLTALPNNLTVMKILDAARRSAKLEKTIRLRGE